MAEAYELADKEEVTQLNAEEQKFADDALAGLTEEQRKKMNTWDVITTIRGYSTYEPRDEETNKAMKAIADWRDEVKYDKFMSQRLPEDEKFHQLWPERVYGTDKLGHSVVGFKVQEVKSDELVKIENSHMLRLQGQKMATITNYKSKASDASGVQRYKHTLVVDLAGSGWSLLGGQKRTLMKEIMDVGGNYFPESIWKIYAINAPFIFRALWAVVKPWVHPVTQAKINILGGSSAALAKMQEDGITLDNIPDFIGGEHKGDAVFDLLLQYIKENGGDTAPAPCEESADGEEGEAKESEAEKAEKEAGKVAAAAGPAKTTPQVADI